MLKKNYKFGEKIRLVRERKQITLKTIAEAVKVSESMISQIERNKVSPSIDTLMNIADFLEIDIEYLFRDFKQNKKVMITRKGNANVLSSPDYIYSRLCSIPETEPLSPVEAVWLEIKRGKEKGDIEFGHKGYEIGIIIEGEATLIYGTEKYTLSSGDSISYSADIPHIIKNTGEETLKAVWILSPPKVFTNSNRI